MLWKEDIVYNMGLEEFLTVVLYATVDPAQTLIYALFGV